MSMVRCAWCSKLVDTDDDPEACYVLDGDFAIQRSLVWPMIRT